MLEPLNGGQSFRPRNGRQLNSACHRTVHRQEHQSIPPGMGGGLDLNKFLWQLQALLGEKALAAEPHGLPFNLSLET